MNEITEVMQRLFAKKKTQNEPEAFRDMIPVYTTPSGTQYVRAADLLLNDDEETWEDIRRLRQTIKAQRSSE